MSISWHSMSMPVWLSLPVKGGLLGYVLKLFNLTIVLTSEIIADFAIFIICCNLSIFLSSFEFTFVSRTILGRFKDTYSLIEVIDESSSICFTRICSWSCDPVSASFTINIDLTLIVELAIIGICDQLFMPVTHTVSGHNITLRSFLVLCNAPILSLFT